MPTTPRARIKLQRTRYEPRHCLFRSVSRLARSVTASYDAALRPAGLSAGQFTVLMTVAALGPSTVGALARKITADSSTIPRLVAPLAARNLLALRVGEDRRQRIIHLTRAGEKLLNKALPLWQRGHIRALAQVGVERWPLLRKELAMLRDSLAKVAVADQLSA